MSLKRRAVNKNIAIKYEPIIYKVIFENVKVSTVEHNS